MQNTEKKNEEHQDSRGCKASLEIDAVLQTEENIEMIQLL